MYYRFSIDDNIWFLRDINSNNYSSIFENPYLGFFKNLHEKYGARFQFNIYYETEGFDLSEMTDRYRDEWRENADWLRLSFHGRYDIGEPPYMNSSYEEAFEDCQSVHREILRFAGEDTLSYFTTILYCQASPEALRAFYDCGLRGLVGLFEDGRYCYVPMTHKAILGEIVDLLESFKNQPVTLEMPEIKNRVCKCNKTYLQAIGVLFILLLVGLLLWHSNANSNQA